MKREEYINKLISQVRCEKVHPMIEEEIRQHIEDEKERYISFGKSEEEAEELAVKQMGNPVDAGKQLDEVHRPLMAWDVIIMVLIAAGVGLISQFLLMRKTEISSFMPNPMRGVITFVFGITVMILIGFVDYTKMGRCVKILYPTCSVIFLIIQITNGAPTHFDLGILFSLSIPMYFNLNQYVLLLLPLYGALIYGQRGTGWKGFIKTMLFAIPILLNGMLSLAPSVFIIIVLSCGMMVILSVVKNWFEIPKKSGVAISFFVMFVVPATGIFMFLNTVFSGRRYLQDRVNTWLHPFRYDMEHAFGRFTLDFIRQNRLFGMNPLLAETGWKESLPGGNDYGLAYLAAYYGVAVAYIVAFVIGILLFRNLILAVRQKNPMGMMIASGASLSLLLEFTFSVLCNVGVLPSVGNCPFLTYSGNGMLVTGILIGMLLSVYRHQNIVDEARIKLHQRRRSKSVS